jgi:aerobic-type carbon monoxide dehydrogenase small subunit (CoxS/CutS family)
MDGKPIPSCMVLALKAEGKEITTIEGLGSPGNLHPIQKAFLEEHAFQCGFCTPGIILSAKALIDRKEPLTALQVSHALDGHICRCGSYPQIVKAIMRAADSQKKELRHE